MDMSASPPAVQIAWNEALECARKGDVKGELAYFILGHLLMHRFMTERNMAATESDARLLAHCIMGSFHV
jgi:hypothetical protein